MKNLNWGVRAQTLSLGAVGALTAALAGPALAADDDIEEIIVSANRIETKRTQTGSSVSVVTAADIELRQAASVTELLRRLPGISSSTTGGLGGATAIRLRGADAGQTLILINGVKLNDPSTPGNQYNFANLTTGNIERIEVLQGPQSTLYGSSAISGVINIITRRATDGTSLSANIEGGSFTTGRGDISLGMGDGPFAVTVNLGYVRSDGFSAADENDGNSESDAYKHLNLSLNTSLEVNELVAVGGYIRYSESDLNFDAFDFVLGIVDGDETEDAKDLQVGFHLNADLIDGRWKNRFSANLSNIDRNDFALGAQTFAAVGRRQNYDYLGTIKLDDAATLILGAELEKARITTESFGFFASFDSGEADITSLFSEIQLQPLEGLTLTGGFRFDDHQTFGNHTSFRTTLAYYFAGSGTLFRANWGEGFKAPTLFQLFSSFGNAGLQPETSKGWEAGIEQEIFDTGARISATYFERDVENQIDFNLTTFVFDNLVQTATQGIEITALLPVGPRFGFNGNYTYLKARDVVSDAVLLRRPKHSANADVYFLPLQDVTISAGFRYVGTQQDTAGPLKDFFVVNLRGSWQFNDNVEVYGRIENVLNREYQEVTGFGTADISFYLGLRLKV
jgi:vitamin B12 transporter